MLLHRPDCDLFYEVRGEGPDVVMLHPFPSSHEYWLPVLDALAGRYRLILPDLRGLGQSGAGDGPATMRKHAEDVAAVCDAVGVTRAAFVGCSIGGYVSFEIWRRMAARVRAVVLTNTKASADSETARVQRLEMADDVLQKGPDFAIDAMLGKLLGETTRRNRPDVVRAARATMERSTAQGIAAIQRGMAERPDSIPTLGKINVPALVIAGEEDVLTPRDEMERIARGIPGAEFKMIAGAGHLSAMERPEEVATLLRGFLDKVCGRD